MFAEYNWRLISNKLGGYVEMATCKPLDGSKTEIYSRASEKQPGNRGCSPSVQLRVKHERPMQFPGAGSR